MNEEFIAIERGLALFRELRREKMNFDDLVDALDQRYGNPHAKECHLIQEAIKVLRLQAEEIHALHGEIAELQSK